jgi:hypothetical protein
MLNFESMTPKIFPFSLLAALFDYLVAQSWLDLGSKGPPPTFSAPLRRSGWAAQLVHYCCQAAPDLLRTKRAVPTFPRSQYRQAQTLGYYQLVVNQAHNLRPQLELARLAQAGLRPQEVLFVEPETMFYRETPLVSGPDFAEGKFTLTRPDKPAFQRVAPFETFPETAYLDYAQGQLGGLAQVQTLPFAHYQFGTSLIYALPLLRGLAVSSRSVTLKAPSMFGWRTAASLPRCHQR